MPRPARAVREAASFRWPWWYVAATAALMLAISAAMDFDDDAVLFTVVYPAGLPVAQRMTAQGITAPRLGTASS
jgi:hypothetical protein